MDAHLEALQTEALGRYLTFRVSGSDVTLVMRSSEDMTKTYLLYGAGGTAILAVAAAVFSVLRRKKKATASPPAPAEPAKRS